MKLTVESCKVEEIKSFIVDARIPFTPSMLESEEKFTFKELFEALTSINEDKAGLREEVEEEAEEVEDDLLTTIIKANKHFEENQIVKIVQQRFMAESKPMPAEHEVRIRIRVLKA